MNVFAAVLEDFHKLDKIKLWRLTELYQSVLSTVLGWLNRSEAVSALASLSLWCAMLCHSITAREGSLGMSARTGKGHGSWLPSAAAAAFRAESSNSAERNHSNLLQIDVSWLCQSSALMWVTLLLGITENSWAVIAEHWIQAVECHVFVLPLWVPIDG